MLKELLKSKKQLVVIEDNILHGGLGSMILEETNKMTFKYEDRILIYGINDKFVSHGQILELQEDEHMDKNTISNDLITLFEHKRNRQKSK